MSLSLLDLLEVRVVRDVVAVGLVGEGDDADRIVSMRRVTPIHRIALGFSILAMLLTLTAPAISTAASSAPQPSPASRTHTTTRSIRVTTPRAYQVVQRGSSTKGTLRVVGTTTNLSGSIEASWRGGPWRTIAQVRWGRFAGQLSGQPAGQGTLRVRSATHRSITKSVRFVGIGDIFVIAGQSNAAGYGRCRSSYTCTTVRASLFGNDYHWHPLTDPTDSNVNQRDTVSRDSKPGGSAWPLVGTILATAHGDGVPIAFVPCARGASTIEDWRRTTASGNTTLYSSMVKRVRAVGGARAVLFWQGESDALMNTSRAHYRKRAGAFCAAVRRDLRIPVVLGQIGDYSDALPRIGIDNVRLAQEDLWRTATTNALAGPSLYDIDLAGDVHFLQGPQIAIAAQRWAAAIDAAIYKRGDGTGPVLTTATYDGALEVQLIFNDISLPLQPTDRELGGFTLTAGDAPLTITSARVTSVTTVTLTLAQPTTKPLAVSLGSFRSGAGAAVPRDSSPAALPARCFVGVPVKRVTPTPQPSPSESGLGEPLAT